MDICLIKTEKDAQIRPISIHGMLWLQTHFETAHWESLASNLVKLSIENASALSVDAKKAGLKLSCMLAHTVTGNTYENTINQDL